MNLWKELRQRELTRLQKILLGVLIISLVMLVPESSFLLDVGGIDLILFMLFMYSQNIKVWLDTYFRVLHYPTIDRQTFVIHSTVSSLFLWFTGSVVLAYGIFLISMFMKGGY